MGDDRLINISVLMPEHLVNDLRQLAVANERVLSQEIRVAAKQHVEATKGASAAAA